MSGSSEEVLAEAREHIEAGRAWQARDVLAERVETERDDDALLLLGHVLHGMGDLPRAGAAWFAVGAKGPEADEAVAAWREQAADDFGVMWRGLPPPYRDEPRAPRIEALRARALANEPDLEAPISPLVSDNTPTTAGRPEGAPAGGRTGASGPSENDEDEVGLDGAQVIGWILGALFVACAVIGFVTVLGWVVPDV